ncbi:hypothetical protein LIA77_05782 [Sarocladium implicatum]|nr:hypothetical protein LIA77_05782 [Sarocladium implicatum]
MSLLQESGVLAWTALPPRCNLIVPPSDIAWAVQPHFPLAQAKAVRRCDQNFPTMITAKTMVKVADDCVNTSYRRMRSICLDCCMSGEAMIRSRELSRPPPFLNHARRRHRLTACMVSGQPT